MTPLTDPQAEYWQLIAALRAGQQRPRDEIARVLAAAGRTHADLVDQVFAIPEHLEPPPAPGDLCDCGGKIAVYTSRRRRSVVVQYLRCQRCGGHPGDGKRVVPAALVRSRQKKPV